MILRPLLLSLPLLPLAGCRTPPVKVDPAESAAPVAVRLLVLDFDPLEAREASGFFVRPGVLVTRAHVLAGGEPFGVTLPDGCNVAVAETLATDGECELALLSVETVRVKPLPLADAGAVPRGGLRAVTKAGVERVWFVGPHEDPETGAALLLSAPGLSAGASGGALVDGTGRVFGVIRGAVDDNPHECVAVPAARLRALLIGL